MKDCKILPTTEQNLQDLWENYKRNSIHVIGISEKEERWKGTVDMLGTKLNENLTKIVQETKPQIQESLK